MSCAPQGSLAEIVFNTPVNINATNAGETDILHFALLNPIVYTLRGLRLKTANPGPATISIRLYQLINNVLTFTDQWDINAGNWLTFFDLMDMFGVPHISDAEIQVTAIASAAGPYAVTGQYSYAIVV